MPRQDSIDDSNIPSSASSYMMDDTMIDTGSQRTRYTAYQSSLEEEEPIRSIELPRKMARENSIVAEMLSENTALQVISLL